MTPERFRAVVEALYGCQNYEQVATDLSVNLRTCQRWASGRRDIPDLAGELAALCHEKSRELAWLAEQLANSPESAPTDSGSAG